MANLPVVRAQDENEDPGSELVADIGSQLEARFPELEHSREVLQTIEDVVQQRAYLFSGPNPPPHLLAEYERICPGWATRLLEQGEREQLWRIEKEREQLVQTKQVLVIEGEDRQAARKLESRSLIFGFLAFLIVASIGAYALYVSQIAVALTCFTTFVLGVVGMFVTRKWKPDSSKEKP